MTTHGGRTGTGIDAVDWARQATELGAGVLAHFAPAVDAGADAVLAASVFHFGTLRIGQVKGALHEAGHPVR